MTFAEKTQMDKVIKAEEDFYKDQNSYKLISFL